MTSGLQTVCWSVLGWRTVQGSWIHLLVLHSVITPGEGQGSVDAHYWFMTVVVVVVVFTHQSDRRELQRRH